MSLVPKTSTQHGSPSLNDSNYWGTLLEALSWERLACVGLWLRNLFDANSRMLTRCVSRLALLQSKFRFDFARGLE
jgi:hypothetical protein